jgi:hypothetical protein
MFCAEAHTKQLSDKHNARVVFFIVSPLRFSGLENGVAMLGDQNVNNWMMREIVRGVVVRSAIRRLQIHCKSQLAADVVARGEVTEVL